MEQMIYTLVDKDDIVYIYPKFVPSKVEGNVISFKEYRFELILKQRVLLMRRPGFINREWPPIQITKNTNESMELSNGYIVKIRSTDAKHITLEVIK